MPDRNLVVVYIEGGLVSSLKKPADVAVDIIDFDIEGSEDEALCQCEMGDSPHFHAHYRREEEA